VLRLKREAPTKYPTLARQTHHQKKKEKYHLSVSSAILALDWSSRSELNIGWQKLQRYGH